MVRRTGSVYGVVALCLTSNFAQAADLSPLLDLRSPSLTVPAHRWTGLYAGANAGYATMRRCWSNSNIGGIAISPSLSEGCHDADGATLGAQAGYRFQVGPVVLGVEGQYGAADLRGANASLVTAPNGALGFLGLPTSNHTRINSIGSITGQVGYAVNRALIYVKAGAAVTTAQYQGRLIATNTVFDTARDVQWGAAIGGGVEFAVTSQWSVGLDYTRLLMGTRDLRFTSTVPPVGALSRVDSISGGADIATLRLNYRWDIADTNEGRHLLD